MSKEIPKGQRKLTVDRETANYLLMGLAMVLATAGFLKVDATTCSGIYLCYCAAIYGKVREFRVGNEVEHKAVAKAEAA